MVATAETGPLIAPRNRSDPKGMPNASSMPRTAHLLAVSVPGRGDRDRPPAFAVRASSPGCPPALSRTVTGLPPAEIAPTGVNRTVTDPEFFDRPVLTTR